MATVKPARSPQAITAYPEMAGIADNIPVVMHDCTGPFALLSGLHVATSSSNVAWQETLRAHIQLLYPNLIEADENIQIEGGYAKAPEKPGIGATWLPNIIEA